ncbi:spermatogenesis associated 2-like [Salminus brasiliensis]|uniref:spermatogenesis associated 2-like n=1 Tax=Salminus brasiliensis TaxID=930266 RepID=UPI003B82E3D9
MSAGVKDKKRGGLLEMYEANLQRRIQQGDWNLVCRDEELCKEVEGLLSRGAAHDTHSSLGLDPLSVMEASLQTSLPNTSRQTGLERLAKAFEVLELAALNLYVCPWRKEYRVVKMFSGMFTHYVKPALTSQQAEELFRLLGYQPTGTSEAEELRLSSKPVKANSLLQLACAFFSARMECQLLLSSVPPLGSCVEWELQLVRERKLGHSLQVAQQSAQRKLESVLQSSEHDMTTDLDLYTDDHQDPGERAETNHMTAPPNSCYTPPKETLLSPKAPTQSKIENNENTGKTQTVCISTMTYQISPKPYSLSPQKTELSPKPLKIENDNEKQVTPKGAAQISVSNVEPQICSCFEPYDQYAYHCVQCKKIHNLECPCFARCQEQGHDLRQLHQHRMDVPSQTTQGWETPPKNNLKKHVCMDSPTSDFFCVCYDCYNIHDFLCEDLQSCQILKHNLQSTGKVQPPQGECGGTAPPERHECLMAEDVPYVLCFTCNKFHYCLCEEGQKCRTSHAVKYWVEMNKEKAHAPSVPLTFHQCCISTQPTLACLTCRVFHNTHCDMQCFQKHRVQSLDLFCRQCTQPNFHILCRYCCAQYCKNCWFKNPMNCLCGMPFDNSSPV